jgi:hypothetical protein
VAKGVDIEIAPLDDDHVVSKDHLVRAQSVNRLTQMLIGHGWLYDLSMMELRTVSRVK